jgi:hypothetical protein
MAGLHFLCSERGECSRACVDCTQEESDQNGVDSLSAYVAVGLLSNSAFGMANFSS